MSDVQIYRNSSDKPLDVFVADLKEVIEGRGFAIYHQDKSDLVGFYRSVGIDLPEHYQHIMLQICKPESSGKSLYTNPERCVFVQKFIFAYSKGDKSHVCFLGFSDQLIGDLLGHNCYENGPDDDVFAERMKGTYATMRAMIEEAV